MTFLRKMCWTGWYCTKWLVCQFRRGNNSISH